MKVVKELVEHHVEEEEEEYFPESDKTLGKDHLEELGQKYEDWKRSKLKKSN